MTTQELIAKVEEIFLRRGQLISSQLIDENCMSDIGTIYNMTPDLIATLKKYREALESIYKHQSFVVKGIGQGLSTTATIAKNALED